MTWNVYGGGKADLIGRVAAALEVDIFVIIGCAPAKAGPLAKALALVGLPYYEAAPPSQGFSTMIAAKEPIRRLPSITGPNPGLWLAVESHNRELAIAGAYVPLSDKLHPTRKTVYWRWLLSESDLLLTRPTILLGDLNTGDQLLDRSGGTKFADADAFAELGRRGWRDAYTEANPGKQAFSWWSAVNGFRIDHAFLSPTAPTVRAATYVEEVQDLVLVNSKRAPGVQAISDHAALVVDLN